MTKRCPLPLWRPSPAGFRRSCCNSGLARCCWNGCRASRVKAASASWIPSTGGWEPLEPATTPLPYASHEQLASLSARADPATFTAQAHRRLGFLLESWRSVASATGADRRWNALLYFDPPLFQSGSAESHLRSPGR